MKVLDWESISRHIVHYISDSFNISIPEFLG